MTPARLSLPFHAAVACIVALTGALVLRPAAADEAPAAPKGPPVAAKRDHIVEVHGKKRNDPYAWLRDSQDPAVLAHLVAENEYAEAFLSDVAPLRKQLYDEYVARMQEDDESVPARRGSYFYWTKTLKGAEHSVLMRRPEAQADVREVVLDVNALAAGSSFCSVGAAEPSPNQKLLAYTIDLEGSERYELRIRDLATATDVLTLAKGVGSVEWADSSVVLYTLLDDTNRPYKVMAQRVDGASEAKVLFDEQDAAFYVGIDRSRSGDFIFISSGSNDTSEVWAVRTLGPHAPELLLARREGIECSVEHQGAHFYVRTNDGAQGFQVLRMPVAMGADGKRPVEVVAAPREGVTVEGIDGFAGFLVIYERRDGMRRVVVRDSATGASHEVAFPEPAYSVSAGENYLYDTATLRLEYESLVTPSATVEYHVAKRQLVELKREVVHGYDAKLYKTHRLEVKAKDGALIPVILVERVRGEEKGPRPLYLYGYGAYGSTMDPWFSLTRLSLLDRGFVYAVAQVRGGGEKGRPWYEAGKLERKVNSFTDFIACAEHLIESGWTTREQLAASGGSAGGLLMGAVTNMRPDLFGAVVADVPFVDVLNTMSDPSLPLTVTEYDEWGNPGDPVAYERMAAYSPYDNVRAAAYPAMLVTAGLHDTRVGYWEATKWVARLRELGTGKRPLILKVNMDAGHGGSSGRYAALEEIALEQAFLLKVLGKAK